MLLAYVGAGSNGGESSLLLLLIGPNSVCSLSHPDACKQTKTSDSLIDSDVDTYQDRQEKKKERKKKKPCYLLETSDSLL